MEDQIELTDILKALVQGLYENLDSHILMSFKREFASVSHNVHKKAVKK